MASDNQIDVCLATLASVYPQHFKQVPDAKFARQIYHRILKDVDGDLLEAATMQWLSTSRPFHPSPGELRDMALSLIERGEPSADAAWSEVLDAVRRVGSYGVPTWSNERIAKTMKSFGYWKDFCLLDFDQLGIVRAQFMRIYEAQSKRLHDERLTLPETQQKLEALQIMNGLTKKLSAPR